MTTMQLDRSGQVTPAALLALGISKASRRVVATYPQELDFLRRLDRGTMPWMIPAREWDKGMMQALRSAASNALRRYLDQRGLLDQHGRLIKSAR